MSQSDHLAAANLLLPIAAGAIYVASPGPVLVSTIRWGARGGLRDAFSVQLGAFSGDLPYLALAVSGFAELSGWLSPKLVAAVGAVILVFLGWLSIRDARRAPAEGPALTGHRWSRRLRKPFVEGLVLAATNPLSIAFWLSATAGIATGGTVDHVPLALGGFLAGNLVCAAGIAGGISILHRHTGPPFWQWTAGVCGLSMIAFGALLGRSALP